MISSARLQPVSLKTTLVQPSDSAHEPQAVGNEVPRSDLHSVLLHSAKSRTKPNKPSVTTRETKMIQNTIFIQPGLSYLVSSSTLGTGSYSVVFPLRLNSLFPARFFSELLMMKRKAKLANIPINASAKPKIWKL